MDADVGFCLQVDQRSSWLRQTLIKSTAMSHHRYPSTDNELMLYRVLQHANLVQYYEAFVSQGTSFSLILLLQHSFNGLLSRTTWVSQYQKCKTSLDLDEARGVGVLGWHWHQLDHMQTICTLLLTDNHTNTSSLIFYRLDARPDTQPTVSKHWRPDFSLIHWEYLLYYAHKLDMQCIDIKWRARPQAAVAQAWEPAQG